jgi:hypothetical protein
MIDDVAAPLASVVSVSVVVPLAKVPLAPVEGAENVTATPLTGFDAASSTVAASGDANAVLISADCDVPLVAVMVSGAPAAFVNTKLAGADTPAIIAVTVYGPAVPFAVNTADVAMPLALLIAVVTVEAVSVNIPLASLGGAVNVTVTPLTGFWPLSKTVTTRRAANGVLMGALCGVPLIAVTEAGAPVVFVRLKFAGRITPGTEAVTTYAPEVPFAMNAGDVAIPFKSVVAVAVLEEVLENVPLGPMDGAVNVTTTPLVGAPFVVTVATRAAPNAALMAWLCGVPLVAATAITGVISVVGVLCSPVVQLVSATAQRHAIASA